jgi:exonuclease III
MVLEPVALVRSIQPDVLVVQDVKFDEESTVLEA